MPLTKCENCDGHGFIETDDVTPEEVPDSYLMSKDQVVDHLTRETTRKLSLNSVFPRVPRAYRRR